MHPRILIIGTSPYTTSGTSRTYDASFHFWERENVVQIFSRNWIPNKGHCGELYQITDSMLLKNWLGNKKTAGKVYYFEDLPEQKGNQVITDNKSVSFLYKLGAKHFPAIEIMRKILWRKKFWCTDQLNEWLDKFQPECILYSFSNHIFMQQIVLYVADRFNIPIITGIGDDFYFNDKKSFSPAYLYYRHCFKELTDKILFRKNSSASYCSNKIRDKYNYFFHLKGKTIFYNSMVERRPFRCINQDDPLVVYFGSIRLGRNNSLIDIANALYLIDPHYKIEVYSGETDSSFYGKLKKHPNVVYGGSIPYSEVQKRIALCDIYVIAEGFREEDINFTRYSLSTKTSDSLASGAAILTYGPEGAGVVDYMKETGASMVCTNPLLLKNCIKELISNRKLQKDLYDQAVEASNKNHSVERTTAIFLEIVKATLGGNKQE